MLASEVTLAAYRKNSSMQRGIEGFQSFQLSFNKGIEGVGGPAGDIQSQEIFSISPYELAGKPVPVNCSAHLNDLPQSTISSDGISKIFYSNSENAYQDPDPDYFPRDPGTNRRGQLP